MSGHLTGERLHDFVDRLLPATERQAAEAHLAACPECRVQVRELTALLAELAALPRSVSPGIDLRPGIHARIAARRSVRRRLATAAAIGLVLVSAGVWSLHPGDVPVARAVPEAGAGAELRELEENYRHAASELLGALEAQGDRLDPDAAALLRHHLQVIDAAISESQAALRQDPQSDALRRLLLVGHERKLEVLRRAADLGITT